MFSGAQNTRIYGGNFIVTTGDTTNQVVAQERIDMAVLKGYTSPGAAHDSSVRSDVPKCHENTRVEITNNIARWERLPSGHPFLWMYGPAGSGKTTIAQTMAERFEDSDKLAASFFFSRSAPGRPTVKDQFVATIAYQLCSSLRGLRPYILQAVVDHPSIFDKVLLKQADVLIIKPLNHFMNSQDPQTITTSAPRVILIDGLDECTPSKSHKEILDIAARCQRQSSLPLRFLISSRPESKIRAIFSANSLGPVTQGLPLDNDYQTLKDTRTFLVSEFNKIRENHPAGKDLPLDWPNQADIEYLAKKSSGQFVYVSVAMKYISDEHRHPLHSLDDVKGISGTKATPFADLDALYTFCLSSIPPENRERILDTFHWMMATYPSYNSQFYYYFEDPHTKSLFWADNLFGRGVSGTTRVYLDGLHSIIHVPDDDHIELTFFHASFSDFLYDQSRSGPFCIDPGIANSRLAGYFSQLTHLTKPATGILLNMQQTDIVLAIFFHCQASKLVTPELQQQLHDLDVTSILKYNEVIPSPEWWKKMSLFWNFTVWLGNQPFFDNQKALHSRFQANINAAIKTRMLSAHQRFNAAGLHIRLPRLLSRSL